MAKTANFHPRNKHQGKYDFKKLVESLPDLKEFVQTNQFGNESIDFSDPKGVRCLNRALLKLQYEVDPWDIPEGFLCPPIPGRADYIHAVADLLKNDPSSSITDIPTGPSINALDIGTGASCIYPIIGIKEYGWKFVGADIDTQAIKSAKNIASNNSDINAAIDIRRQHDHDSIYENIIKKKERFDIVVCNPPFHGSAAEAALASGRKRRNLHQSTPKESVSNFGGKNHELWCEGGEEKFIKDLVYQSREFGHQCLWFSTLVSKKENVYPTKKILKKIKAASVVEIPLSHGNKTSRIIAWTLQSHNERRDWIKERWT